MQHLKRLHSITLIGLIALLVLAGCAAPQPAAESTGDSVGGGQIVLIIPEEPAQLNQYLAVAAIVRQVSDATTAPLATVNAEGQFVPVLAAELPSLANGGVSDDFLTITWKLRPDLKWSDGTPLTSEDIKFTWQAVAHPNSGAVLSAGFDLIEDIETPDPLTAVVKYRSVNQAYLQQFMFGIFPAHAAGPVDDMSNWDYNRNPTVSAGPFVLDEWRAGDSISMTRNPNYYLPGQPYLDRIIFRIVPDPGAQLAIMAQGEGDVHLWPGEEMEVYNAQMGGVATLQEIPGQWNMAMRFNLSRPFDGDPVAEPPHPILGDLRVRQAIAHAINYDQIVTEINPGTIPVNSPFAYGWYQCDQPRVYDYDVARAKALLEEAGWVEGPGGIRIAQGAAHAPDGTRLTIQLNGYTNFQPLVRLEEALAEMFKVVGIETTIQNDDFSIIFGSWSDGAPRKLGNFDVLIYDASLTLEPHASLRNQFHSSAIPSADNPAGANYSRWVNAQADAALERAGSTVDVPTRQAAYCELAELIATELPQLHLFLFTEGYGTSYRLTGFQGNMWGSLTWDVQNWRLQ